jgi:hypothetical protein
VKPAAQRIAIAEACGWQFANPHSPEMKETEIMCWMRPGNGFWQTEKLPDYLNDLNAMHQAESMLTDLQRLAYSDYTYDIALKAQDKTGKWRWISLPAAQRAEAFLRTIDRWKEVGRE